MNDYKDIGPFYLRLHECSDMTWVIQQHGRFYKNKYGFDESFEAATAQICADFLNHYDPQKERCWIAEIKGEQVGSIFCIKASEEIAKLRLLLVDTEARGLGLGTCLVEECIQFAKYAGYKKLTLWTAHILLAARHIYQKKGFKRVSEETQTLFGHDLIGETWELIL